MKILEDKSFQEVQQWIFRNARHLEYTIWRHAFENGNKEDVLLSLYPYQNDDGGFGNALEPDNWNPNSSPYTTLYAINILKDIDFYDINHPLIQGIFKYIDSGMHFSQDGEWFFVIPSNNDYPHAPWWAYHSKERQISNIENIGISAEIAAFIIQYADANSKLFDKAINTAHNMFNRLKSSDNYGDMGIGGYCMLAEAIKTKGLTNIYDYEYLLKLIKKLVYRAIERDLSNWIYCKARPSQFIKSPDSIFYKDNEDIVKIELDYLIDTKPKNDVWGIEWSWYDNDNTYPKESILSENWWKAFKAIEKIRFLKNFNRL